MDITCCIVLYKNNRKILLETIVSFLKTDLIVKLFLIDNSPTDELNNICLDDRIEYIHNPSNPGFGASHNIAINKVIGMSKYHLVLNPDISFDGRIIDQIRSYLDNNSDIGVLMPKVLYPDNSLQFLAKLLPTPIDFIIRRFIPFKKIKEIIAERFELRLSGYNKIIDVPFLSGCFLMFRTDVLAKIGGFDDRIFMYTEDIDICRRVLNANYRSVFYPDVFVYHDYVQKPFTDFKNFEVYLKSSIYYFNKWGWFFDKDRKEINKKTLLQIK